MRTPAQRGPVGNWLRDERLARQWRSAAVARRNLERAGIKVAPSVYAEWEAGTRIPSERQLNALVAYYGTQPGHEAAAPGGTADILAALRLQVQVNQTLMARADRAEDERQGLTDQLALVRAQLDTVLRQLGIEVATAGRSPAGPIPR